MPYHSGNKRGVIGTRGIVPGAIPRYFSYLLNKTILKQLNRKYPNYLVSRISYHRIVSRIYRISYLVSRISYLVSRRSIKKPQHECRGFNKTICR
ncbi:hypothetical protein OH492_06255 [Vibrio chagasii]|nr:hypothetical protein [Vibrio chagasii]